MGYSYTIKNQYGMHFITCTVHQWVDIFTRTDYIAILLDSIRFCQKRKGLKVYAWVIMSNHIHLIVSSTQDELSDIIRDLKKFTSRQIVQSTEANPKESRKRWLLWLFKKDNGVCFWEEGYHGEEILTQSFFNTKLNYIHMNPVRAGIVDKEEDYVNSSCAEHYGTRMGALELNIDLLPDILDRYKPIR
ncbi:REP-associated tyrosine transposase [Taibaiella soli]|uniref:Transposase n=1 Tax=Taibaiella soli TaxID=1649169 RepID=A0A2W2B5R0_9BACT|nr:transposase [Taibaiella soli]PZF71317.1 transposase [Taibaiella soli]